MQSCWQGRFYLQQFGVANGVVRSVFGGGARILDDIIHDRVNGVIWHHLCNATYM